MLTTPTGDRQALRLSRLLAAYETHLPRDPRRQDTERLLDSLSK